MNLKHKISQEFSATIPFFKGLKKGMVACFEWVYAHYQLLAMEEAKRNFHETD